MDNYTKAGSWELPTYQADLALPQTQAKIEVNGLFKKTQLAIVHLFPAQWLALGTRQQQAASMETHTGRAWYLDALCVPGRKAPSALYRGHPWHHR